MAEVRIRPATLNDLETLLRFEQGVVEAERPFDPTLREETIHYYQLPELIASSQALVLVAEVEQQVVGSGYARILAAKPYLKHEQYAYLGFMYVAPAYRGQGLNGLILQHLTQWAAAQGLTEMRLEVYAHNQPAVRAYEKAGFAAHMLEMRRAI
ncbi:GNAT family N-acetyltransferase [Hymenobacter sp. BT770]|uniref:GNAT family N-acetyltransferase n=1 Tax=Hymenobacter sp. BT770 TaxID=2886942 RepID=UPI001D12FDDF|nr:GNAT family N-acetyltransferase [Hymenobacter sp. BT770]MCC3153400.1 GNAT family N-acetyltransferase [Hymenobacter sp. BT770]MDO3415518.1 GNAT family N-acetyltransferase [Hymenobacter sp. BT770]